MTDLILSKAELEAMTGYEHPTKQLQVLHSRGFNRAFINRKGQVVLERPHYESVARGDSPTTHPARKSANLSFLKRAA